MFPALAANLAPMNGTGIQWSHIKFQLFIMYCLPRSCTSRQMSLLAFFSVMKAHKNIKIMKAPKKFPASVFSLISLAIITIVNFWDPPSDYIYYGAVIAAMVGIICNIADMIMSYNYLAMRPLPQFDMYKGGDDRGF